MLGMTLYLIQYANDKNPTLDSSANCDLVSVGSGNIDRHTWRYLLTISAVFLIRISF